MILGNDIAVRAITDHQTNPWPDGTAFAKVAWAQSVDTAGNIRAGEFRQVEFMIKDAGKYAASEGWGFARGVKGLQLTPYGKDAQFLLSLVTWYQQDDPHYFGAHIPAALRSVEKVVFDTVVTSSYEIYEGTPLKRRVDPNTRAVTARKAWITGLRASVMP